MGIAFALAALIGAAALFAGTMGVAEAGGDTTIWAVSAWGAAALAGVSARLVSGPALIRETVTWAAAGVILASGFIARADLEPHAKRLVAFVMERSGGAVAAETPARARAEGHGAYSIPRDSMGQYWADATVNGVHVRFLVDTGATVVALTDLDARRIGFNPAELDYSREISTANGVTKVAPIMLDRIAIGPIEASDVRAVTVPEGLNQSLLGMTFLDALSEVEIGGGALILRQ